MNKLFLCLLAVNSITACKRQPIQQNQSPDSTLVAIPRDAVKAPIITREGDSEEPRFDVPELAFSYFTSKSKISFKNPKQTIAATVNVRMKKDSIIWLSAGQFGIEGVRVLITKDSVTMINKLENSYYSYTYPQLSQQFDFSVDFSILQAIFIGDLPYKIKPSEKFKKESDYYFLRQNEGNILVENYVGEQNRKLKKLLARQQSTDNKLSMSFDNFTSLNSMVLPYTSLITVDAISKEDQQFYQTLIEIQHKEVKISEAPLSFPFTIPAKYIRKY